ncbi:MAG: hypothetical protein GDA48_26055 [Hormoscilla sp. GM102CHS1]|nr:hypothetical protein [Hormoscilla sp. GM102CHS1]
MTTPSPSPGNSPGIALWGTPILAAMGMIALWQTPYLQPPLPVTDPKPLSPSELPPIQQNVVATIPPVLPPRSVQNQRVSFGAGATGDFAGYCRPPSDATLLA